MEKATGMSYFLSVRLKFFFLTLPSHFSEVTSNNWLTFTDDWPVNGLCPRKCLCEQHITPDIIDCLDGCIEFYTRAITEDAPILPLRPSKEILLKSALHCYWEQRAEFHRMDVSTFEVDQPFPPCMQSVHDLIDGTLANLFGLETTHGRHIGDDGLEVKNVLEVSNDDPPLDTPAVIDVDAEPVLGRDQRRFVQTTCTDHFAALLPLKRKASVDIGYDSEGCTDSDATVPMVHVDGLKGYWERMSP